MLYFASVTIAKIQTNEIKITTYHYNSAVCPLRFYCSERSAIIHPTRQPQQAVAAQL